MFIWFVNCAAVSELSWVVGHLSGWQIWWTETSSWCSRCPL